MAKDIIHDADLDRFYEPNDISGCCSQCEKIIRDNETHFQSGNTLLCTTCASDDDLLFALFEKLEAYEKIEVLGFEEVY